MAPLLIFSLNATAKKSGLLGNNPALASSLGIITWLIGVSLVAGILFAMPRLRRLFLTLMVFSTCHIKKPFYQEVFFSAYRGVDRGFGVTIPDLIFFGYFFYLMLGGAKYKLLRWPYNTTLWVLVILISLLSLIGSPGPALYGLFTVHKLIRCLVLYWVMVNVIKERADVGAVVNGLVAAVIFQGVVVIWAKYVTKAVVYRSVGSFPHPNTLAMYVNLILPIIMCLLLSKCLPKRQNKLAVLAILLGMLCVLFTKSRAAIVIMPAALGFVSIVSIVNKPTFRKVSILSAGLVVITIIALIAVPRIIRRFQKAPEESKKTRVYLNHAARSMAGDHFFGIGINLYSWALENTDYYWDVYPDKVDVPDPEGFRETGPGRSRLGTAHHIYYLFAAEIGWLGMGVFILFVLRLYWRNLVLFFKARDEYYKSILLGMLVGFASVHLTGLLEWIFRQTQMFYLFFIVSGLMVAIGNLLPHRRLKPKQLRQPIAHQSLS